MTSEIRVNKLQNRVGLGTVEFTNTGIVVSGIVTAAQLGGDVLIEDNIVHVGDTDTKIRFHADDKFRIELGGVTSAFSGLKSTSGTTHARWGINVPTPQAVLHIDEAYNHQGVLRVTNGNQNSNYYHQLEMSGTNNTFTLWKHYDGSSYNNTHAHGSTGHVWYIGGNERARITSSGVLKIDRGSAVDEALDIDTTSTTGASRIRFNESGSNKGQLAYSHGNDQIELIGTSGNGAAIFTDGTERVKVTSAGKFHVGITTSSDNYVWSPRARFATESSGDASSIHFGGSTNPAIVLLRRGGSTSWHHHAGKIYTDHRPAIHFETAYATATGSHSFQHHMTMKFNVGVGIGTVDPTGLLDINSASGTYDHLRMRRTASGSGNSDWSLKPYAGNLYFRTAGANDHIVFTSDAKVGINTTSPADVLDINSSQASAVSDVYIRNHASLGGAALNLWTQGTYSSPVYKAIIGCSDAGGTIRMGSVSNHDLLLLTTNTPQVTIKTDGKVGVGTELPAAKLHVIDFNSDPYLKIGGSNRDCGIKLHTGNDFVAMRTDAADRLWINARSESIRFTVGGSSSSNEKLRITSSGRVNVGSAVTGDPWGKTGDVETGVALQSTTTSYGIAANSKDIVGIFNRTNTGGTIVECKYNASVVGEFVTNATDFEVKSTNDLRLTASGGEVVVTGKLGVGVSDPTHSIEAKGSDSSIAVYNHGHSRGGLCAMTNQRLAFASTHVNDDLVFGYSNSPLSTANFVERMRIDNGTATVTIKNYTTDNAQAPYLLFHNRGNDTTDNSNVYNMGGIAAAGYRDVANPSIVAAIQFERQITASGASSGGNIVFRTGFNGTTSHTQISKQVIIDYSGNLYPADDDDVNLGLSSKRWKNLYTADAHFSNIGTGGNEVDGTEGSWTLQEAEDSIYMINRKNGKRYKIKMEEV